MPIADVDGLKLFYRERGEGEPLLLVMGLGADHVAWAYQVPAWSERYRVISFDNRDAGQSDEAEEGYEIADMARDTLGLADHLGLDRFHLLGLSMGGMIAQEVALSAPDRVLTLTLGITTPGSGYWGRERSRLMANAAIRTPREEHIEQLLLLTLSEETYADPERAAFFRKAALETPNPQSPEAFRRQIQAIGRHDAHDRLGKLEMPVHVIGCERDMMVPVWKSHELAELIPNAKLTIIEDAAHGVNLERPDELNRVVLDFLAAAGEREPA